MQILIIDSYREIINRLKDLVQETAGVKDIFSATNYNDAVKLLRLENPGVVILDMNLPENHSIELLKEIKGSASGTHVIVLSIHVNDQLQSQCELLGADYFFDKYHDFEKIPEVIGSIAALKNGGNNNR